MNIGQAFRNGAVLATPITCIVQVGAGIAAAVITVTALKASAVALPLLILAGVGAFTVGGAVAGVVVGIPIAIAAAIVVAVVASILEG